MTARPVRPGTAFAASKLYRFEGTEHAWEITVIRAWPGPAAWRKTTRSEDWFACRPDIDLSLADRAPRKRDSHRTRCEREAASLVPRDVRRLAGRFPHSTQWALLSMLSRVGGGADLLASAPALGAALAMGWLLRPGVRRPLRSARALVRRPRREIAGWLGFPDTEATVRVLGRTEPSGCIGPVLLHLRELLVAGDAWVSHLPALGWEALSLLREPRRDRLAFELVREIAAEPGRRRRRCLFADVMQILERAERLGPAFHLPVLRCAAHVAEVLEDVGQAESRANLDRLEASGPFPAPPFSEQVLAGLPEVRLLPLCTPRALWEHAEIQRNCLANEGEYLPCILDGSGAAFDLSWEERGGVRHATLFLEHVGGASPHWRALDLRLSLNRDPPDWLAERVARFLVSAGAMRARWAGPATLPCQPESPFAPPGADPPSCGQREAHGDRPPAPPVPWQP